MGESAHAINALLLIAYIVPIAVYFLFLGLVNSHARPYLVSSRTDFIALTCVLAPLLIAPIPTLAASGLLWLLAIGAGVLAWVFFAMLPAADAGWVIYNISASRGRAVVDACLRELGWFGTWDDNAWHGDAGRLYVTALPVLRNVSVHLEFAGAQAPRRTADLARAIEARLGRVEQLPSTTGACMVILGIGLLALPVWMMGRHIQDLVEAVAHLFG